MPANPRLDPGGDFATVTWTPASSSLDFLAGICAGAGINVITLVAAGPAGPVPPARIALDAALWVLAAASCAGNWPAGRTCC